MGVVRKDWASQNSIALSWAEVEQPPSDIVDYEVKYYEKVIIFFELNKVVFTYFFKDNDYTLLMLSGNSDLYYNNYLEKLF